MWSKSPSITGLLLQFPTNNFAICQKLICPILIHSGRIHIFALWVDDFQYPELVMKLLCQSIHKGFSSLIKRNFKPAVHSTTLLSSRGNFPMCKSCYKTRSVCVRYSSIAYAPTRYHINDQFTWFTVHIRFDSIHCIYVVGLFYI